MLKMMASIPIILGLTAFGSASVSPGGFSKSESEAFLATALERILSDSSEIEPRKITFVCLPGNADLSSTLLDRVSKPGYQLHRCSDLKYDEVRSPVLKRTDKSGTAVVLQKPSRIGAQLFEMKVTFVRGNLSNSGGILNLQASGSTWEVSKYLINWFS